jgi:hypothetical protein
VRLEAPAGELMANPEVAELYLGGHASESRTARVTGAVPEAGLPVDSGSGR